MTKKYYVTKKYYPTSINLTPETKAYLSWLLDNYFQYANRTWLIEAIIRGDVDLKKYPHPSSEKFQRELQKYLDN